MNSIRDEGMPPFDTPIVAREFLLEKVRLGVAVYISALALHDVQIEPTADMLSKQFGLQLRAAVLGEKLEVFQFTCPRDWWEALKERWAPAWFLRRWPVVWRVENVDLKVLYPKYQIALPEQEHTFRLYSYGAEET